MIWRLARRIFVLSAWVSGAIFASLAIAAVLAGWRLSEGPIKVDFLTPYLQSSLSSLPEGWSIELGQTSVDWEGEQGTLRIRASQVGFINAASQKVLSMPQMAFTIHGDSLLEGRVEPRDVWAENVKLVLTRGADDEWRMGTASAAASTPGQPPEQQRSLGDLAGDLFGRGDIPGRGGVLGRLRLLTLSDVELSVVDQVQGRVYNMDGHRIWLRSIDGDVSLRADLEVSTRDQRLPLRTELVFQPEDNSVSGSVRIGEIGLADLNRALGGPELLAHMNFPVSGEAWFGVSSEEGMSPVRLALKGGEGSVDLPGQIEGPLPVKSIRLEGVLQPDTRTLDIAALAYDAGDFTATSKGRVTLQDDGPSIDMIITSDRTPVTRVPAYWPIAHGRKIRAWIVDNVVSGMARNVEAIVALRPEMFSLPYPPTEAFEVSFEFEEGGVKLPAPFDPLTTASGRIRVTGSELDLDVSSGMIGNIAVSDGRIAIPAFSAQPPLLSADFAASGTIAETIEAVVRGSIAERRDDLDRLFAVGGQAAVRINLSMPVTERATVDDARFAAQANLTEIVADGLLAGLPVRADRLTLKVDNGGAEATGAVRTERSFLDLTWIEKFGGTEAVPREVAFNGVIGLQDAVRGGIPIGDFAGGAAGVTGTLSVARDGGMSGELAADLTSVDVDVKGLGWRKPPGTQARLGFHHRIDSEGGVRFEGLDVSAPGLVIEGDLGVSPEGRFTDGRFERFDIAGSTVSLVVRPKPEGPWDVQMTGERLDLRPWLEGVREREGGFEGLDAASLDIAVGSLVLSDRVRIDDAVGQVTVAEPYPVGDLRGLLNGQTGILIEAANDANGWNISLQSSDAGEVLSSLGLGEALNKGRLSVSAVTIDGSRIAGTALIEDFTLSETPTFARLLSLASFTGIGETLSGRGLSFARAEAPFVYQNGRLDIRKGRMAGPSVGMTSEGSYDTVTDELRFVGNLIPAYSLSEVLGKIPLLGAILGGDQGLFGVTYLVEGPSATPKVTVNPLSALAPGILRQMFLEPVNGRDVLFPDDDNRGAQ